MTIEQIAANEAKLRQINLKQMADGCERMFGPLEVYRGDYADNVQMPDEIRAHIAKALAAVTAVQDWVLGQRDESIYK